MPKLMTKFVAFSRVDFVGFWCVSGCIVEPIFDVFGACSDGSRKTWICKVCRSYREIRIFSENAGASFQKHIVNFVSWNMLFF